MNRTFANPEEIAALWTQVLDRSLTLEEFAKRVKYGAVRQWFFERNPETVSYEVLKEGTDEHAGFGIPETVTTYTLDGHNFKLSTGPDWDNYDEDWALMCEDTLLAELTG